MAKEKKGNILYKAYLSSLFFFMGKSLWLFVKGSGLSNGLLGELVFGPGTLKPSFLGVCGFCGGDGFCFSFSPVI